MWEWLMVHVRGSVIRGALPTVGLLKYTKCQVIKAKCRTSSGETTYFTVRSAL